MGVAAPDLSLSAGRRRHQSFAGSPSSDTTPASGGDIAAPAPDLVTFHSGL